MSKTCEICNRPIKTGRKYCWEHRRTAQANSLNDDKKLIKLNKEYIKYTSSKLDKNFFEEKIFYISLIFFLLVLYLQNYSENVSFFAQLIVFLVVALLLALLITWIHRLIKSAVKETKAEGDIKEKNYKYIEWVKSKVKEEKNECEFKKHLLK